MLIFTILLKPLPLKVTHSRRVINLKDINQVGLDVDVNNLEEAFDCDVLLLVLVADAGEARGKVVLLIYSGRGVLELRL